MNVVETNIPGVKIIENTAFQDNRGAFSRLYCARELKEVMGFRAQLMQLTLITTEDQS